MTISVSKPIVEGALTSALALWWAPSGMSSTVSIPFLGGGSYNFPLVSFLAGASVSTVSQLAHDYVFPAFSSSKAAERESAIFSSVLAGGSLVGLAALVNTSSVSEIGFWNIALAGAGVNMVSDYISEKFIMGSS